MIVVIYFLVWKVLPIRKARIKQTIKKKAVSHLSQLLLYGFVYTFDQIYLVLSSLVCSISQNWKVDMSKKSKTHPLIGSPVDVTVYYGRCWGHGPRWFVVREDSLWFFGFRFEEFRMMVKDSLKDKARVHGMEAGTKR